jgi:hypothetical protein
MVLRRAVVGLGELYTGSSTSNHPMDTAEEVVGHVYGGR